MPKSTQISLYLSLTCSKFSSPIAWHHDRCRHAITYDIFVAVACCKPSALISIIIERSGSPHFLFLAELLQLTSLSSRLPSPLSVQPLDPQSLRHAFASFATGITVITALDSLSNPVGMTVNSFGSISLDPPLVQWSLRVNSGLHRTFIEASKFSVSVLSSMQEQLARQFSSRAPDRFENVAIVQSPNEPPLIANAIAHFVCKKVNDYRVGDHELFIGEVLRANTFEGTPLLFHNSKFKRIG
jgi:flavin reductase (DIM6/NTAB) family NADH-FMN oxidoreductase RutF